MNVDWQTVLAIIVPLCAAMAWALTRIDKRFEKIDQRFDKIDQRFDKIDQRFEKVDQRFEKIEEKLNQISDRVTRLEGRFDERGYWESRFTGTHDREE